MLSYLEANLDSQLVKFQEQGSSGSISRIRDAGGAFVGCCRAESLKARVMRGNGSSEKTLLPPFPHLFFPSSHKQPEQRYTSLV